jgi:hypothetical protein
MTGAAQPADIVIQVHIPPDGSRWNTWLSRAVLAGLVAVELAAVAWIAYLMA